MVFQGYQIPQKNLDARLKNLSLGLKNNALLKTNTTLRIQSINEIKKETDKVSLSTQTSADPNALVDLATMTQLSVDELARKRNISNASLNLDNVSDISAISGVSEPITAKERAIESALRSAKNQAQKEKRVLTKEEERNIIDNINKQSNVLSGLDLARKQKTTVSRPEVKRWINQNTVEQEVKKVINNIINVIEDKEEAEKFINDIKKTVDEEMKKEAEQAKKEAEQETQTSATSATWSSSQDANFNNMPRDMQESQLIIEKLEKINNKKDFENFHKSLVGVKYGSMSSKKSAGTFYPIIDDFNKNKFSKLAPNTKDANLNAKVNKAWDLFESDKDKFISSFTRDVKQMYGTGLKGGSVEPYYAKNIANFGNLYLSNKSLKKNTLTVYRPKSKLHLISQKNISPLLKKMILDIQNTLEFDTNDYNDLEADEKRVIERIIRLQRDMKDYNIKKLIDDDEVKIKKRLDILTAQVNAGNNSKLVRDEMKFLIKQLFKNNAISQVKYNNVIRSIDALGQ